MSPLARSLLALACAALLRAACARQPAVALPVSCSTVDIGNTSVIPSSDGTVKITQVFDHELGVNEYLIYIENYCSHLTLPDGLVGSRYVMARETVRACGAPPVHAVEVAHNMFSPVVVTCDVTGHCGNLTVTVDQYCELRPLIPTQ